MHKHISTFYLLTALSCATAFSADPASFFPSELIRPAPITMAELAKRKTEGVSVAEVSDYVYGNYKGDFPSPPHADGNPKKAFIISWKDSPFRFVFSHESSYCPWFELPSGAGVAYQFFEGVGHYELFNQYGRQERNSFVDVIESGPKRVWIRWTYLGVKHDDPQPTYRGTEDFWAYPNGLILRRQTYQKLKGYAVEPIELIVLCPVGKFWPDVLKKDPASEERHALAVLDAFSTKRHDVYWTPKPTPAKIWKSSHRKAGCAWEDVDNSAGAALVIPLREATPFCVVGDASNFRHDYTRLEEYTFNPHKGNQWDSCSWCNWPNGWANAVVYALDANLLKQYPSCFCPTGVFLTLPHPVQERGVYYSLIGVGAANGMEAIRLVARKWLEKGTSAIIQPDSIADLPAPYDSRTQQAAEKTLMDAPAVADKRIEPTSDAARKPPQLGTRNGDGIPSPSRSSASVVPVDLRCEYMTNPAGIDEKQPRLSWQLSPVDADAYGQRQTAYQVVVSGDTEELDKDQAALRDSGVIASHPTTLWDSGVIASHPTTQVVYQGKPLVSGQQCFWKVRTKDEHGVWSSWSEAARWTMGLLEPSDWAGKWIGADVAFLPKKGEPPPDNEVPDPWLRKTVELWTKPRRATVYVASVGYHELYVNGRKVGDAVLAPCATDHSKRARYVAYEIAELLEPGRNVIGLWLGASWSIFPSYRTGDKPRAPIALAQAELRFFDGDILRVVSDASWKTHPSPNRLLGTWQFRNYGGEQYDANGEQPNWCTAELDDSSWKPAREYSPKLVLSAQMVEPNRPVKELKAVSIERRPGGEWRVDMGVNFAGWTEIAVRGKPGRRVEFEFSERDGEAMTFRNRSAYVIGPAGQGVFRNRFNYSSGRWITVRGLEEPLRKEDVRGWMVRTDFRRATRFECSNALLNWISDTTLWTFENLALGGYVVDCPQRERFGYGGDAHATTETGMFHYQLGALYTKWAEDWRDGQGREAVWVNLNDPATAGAPGSGRLLGGGIMPPTAPTYFGGGGPAWGGYCVTLPWLMYQHYGDQRILEKGFPTICRWLDFLESNVKDGLLARYGGMWDFIGDWLWPGMIVKNVDVPEDTDVPEIVCFNNCYWIYNLTTAARIAEALGRTSEAARWRERASAARAAVHAKFFRPAENSYANGQMAYLAAALLAEVPPLDIRPAVMRRLEHEILVTRRGHIGAGITGGALLFKLLRELGRDDLLLTMALQEDYPGWGFMRANGATTMWEAWEKDRPGHSLLHSSYLYVGAWLIDGIAGIHRDPDYPGFRRFVIRPPRTEDPRLTWAKASFQSPAGNIETAWRRAAGRFDLDVTVPPNTTANVYVPARNRASVTERRQATNRDSLVRWLRDENGYSVFTVQPGRYSFVAENTAPL